MLEGLQSVIGGIGEDVKQFVTEKPLQTATLAYGSLGAAALGVGIVGMVKKRKKTVKRAKKKIKKKTKKGRARDIKFRSKQKHERRYKRKRPYKVYGKKGWIKPKSKSKSKKRTGKIYHTKHGQPYKILASGKARFIKRRK